MKNAWLFKVLCALSLMMSLSACGEDEPERSPVEAPQAEPEGVLSPELEEALKQESGSGKEDTAQLAPGVFTSGVPATRFVVSAQPDREGKQRKERWCWAATLQMVLNFHQVYIVQEDIVQRAFGDLRDLGLDNVAMIAQVIKGWSFVDRFGSAWALDAQGQEFLDPIGMIQDLHFNMPLITALLNTPGTLADGGHVYVISAITYQVDAAGLVYPLYVELSDPWPENQSFTKMSWPEYVSRYYGHVRVRAYPL